MKRYWQRLVLVLASLVFSCAFGPARGATLQDRIDAAIPGSTLLLPAGVHGGPVIIAKPLILRGEPGAEIRGDGHGSAVTIQADHVTLEGFRITGSGLNLGADDAAVFVQGNFATVKNNRIEDSLHGVYLKKANDCRIEGNVIRGKEEIAAAPGKLRFGPDGNENCDVALDQNRRGNGIHLWNCERAAIVGNRIQGARDGIYFSFTHRSKVTANSATKVRFGLHYMYSDYNLFEGNRFEENSAGAVLMYSKGLLIRRNTFASNVGHRAYGLVMVGVDNSRLEENRIAGNSIGIFLELSSGNTLLANSVVQGYIGARLTGSSDANRFSKNLFAGNLHPVEIDGSVGENAWAIDGVGNYWATAEVDLDGDGVGELPHRETDLLGALRRPFPMVALLSGSPALNLVRFAQQNAALPRVPAIVDPAPLVHPSPGTSVYQP